MGVEVEELIDLGMREQMAMLGRAMDVWQSALSPQPIDIGAHSR